MSLHTVSADVHNFYCTLSLLRTIVDLGGGYGDMAGGGGGGSLRDFSPTPSCLQDVFYTSIGLF